VRGPGPDRPVLGRPVDPDAVGDAQPARAERVVRRPARDDLAGERARPGAVGHVPRGIDLLVLDRVAPGGGVEAGHADGDAVALAELDALEQAELEVFAVDREYRVVDPGEVRERDPRLDLRQARVDLARRGRV